MKTRKSRLNLLKQALNNLGDDQELAEFHRTKKIIRDISDLDPDAVKQAIDCLERAGFKCYVSSGWLTIEP